MFGSNGPCSPADYMPHYTSILEPIYYPSTRDSTQQIQPLTFDSDPDCHSSAPPTPDIISGLISLTGGPSPSDLSSGSFGDLTSPEPDYHSASSPPSYSIDASKVQATRSLLIKEGLKLTIQSRRMVQGLDNARPEYRMPPQEHLTPEDEDRRRRRRERNKVAATKCRNKKKGKNREASSGIRDSRNQQQCLKIRNPLSGSRKERTHQPSAGTSASLFQEFIKELLRPPELHRQSCAILVICFRLKMLPNLHQFC